MKTTHAPTLLLALALLTSPRAIADPVSEFEDTLAVDTAGNAELDGKPFKARGPVTTFLWAEVEKSMPSMDGNVILYLHPLEFRQPSKLAVATMEAIKVEGAARPFSYDREWRMYDAEGLPTDDARQAFRVLMPAPTEGDAMAFDVKWNECEGNITGNYSGYKCSKVRGLSDDYMAYLKVNLLPCVTAGLAKVGGGTAEKVHIQHDGTVADANHSGGSLHSAGRAIDTKIMTVTVGGQKRVFDFTKTSTQPQSDHRKYFEGFRACWGALHTKRRCPARSNGPIGTIGWEDRAHKSHHLHTSFPFCPNNRGYFITEGGEDFWGNGGKRVPSSKK